MKKIYDKLFKKGFDTAMKLMGKKAVRVMDEQNEIFCPLSMTGVAGALCAALGVEPPKQAAKANEIITAFAGRCDRVVMYNPDAVALWLFQKYTDVFAPVMLSSQLTMPLQTVMPSVTPVCFATMYTGALPEVHGIQAYRKPVVRTDSVFDALIRAGKKPCIICTEGDSLAKIFLERDMDYFIVDTPEEANAKAEELIEKDVYDLLLVYNGDYDGAMHKCGPEGAAAMKALRADCAAFEKLCGCVRDSYKGRRTLVAFAPDHGCHEIDGGAGSHGLYMQEDMNVIHFYGVIE